MKRESVVKDVESRIMSEFTSNMSNHVLLHWDDKVIKYENLAIVVSFPNPGQHYQFMAAPRIPDSTGSSTKDALLSTIEVWEIPQHHIIGMSWDTTASNTYRHQGSAILFEQEMDQAILWLACHHDVGELHINHADVETCGAWNVKMNATDQCN